MLWKHFRLLRRISSPGLSTQRRTLLCRLWVGGSRFRIYPPACKRTICFVALFLSLSLLSTDAATRTPSSRQEDRTCDGAAATTKPDPARLRRQNSPKGTEPPEPSGLFTGRRRGLRRRTRWRWSRPSDKALFCSVASPRSLDSQPVGLIIATLCTRLRSCARTPLDRGGDSRSVCGAFSLIFRMVAIGRRARSMIP